MREWPWNPTRYSPVTVGIGGRYVHLLQLREREGRVSLHAAERISLPPEGEGIRSVVRAVRPVLETGVFHGRRALLCLKGGDLYIQHQRFSRDESTPIETRVREEFKQRVAFDLDRAEIRYVTAGRVYERGELVDELILMVADREVLDRSLGVLDALGLQAATVGAEPVGLEQLLLRFPEETPPREGATAFLGMGASRTELVVVRKDGLAFTRSVPMGGRELTRALSRKLEIDEESALRLKEALCRGEGLNPTLREAALTAARPVIEALSAEVLSCFRYFSTMFKREPVARLVFAGWEVGGIIDPAFVEGIVGVSVSPWKGSGLFDGERRGLPDSGFAPLVGLAAETLAEGAETVDFLPREVKRKREKHRSMSLRLLSLSSLLFLMVLFVVGVEGRRRSLNRMRILVKGQNTLVDMKDTEMLSLEEKEAALKRKRELLLQVRPTARVSRILAEVTRAVGPGVTVRALRLDRVVSSNRLGDGLASETVPPEGYLVRVKGITLTSGDLSDFIEHLAACRVFSSIREDRYEDEKEGPPGMKSFSVTLVVGKEESREIF